VKALVVGAGHNGLTAALALARAGHTVTVLEARSVLGGIAAGEAFHGAWRHQGVWHDADTVLLDPVRGLGVRVDTRPALPITHLGSGLITGPDGGTVPTNEWQAFRSFLGRMLPFLGQRFLEPAPQIDSAAPLMPLARPALELRKLGPDMLELLRLLPTSIEDFLAEHFTDPAVRAALAWPALFGAWAGPMSPGTTATWLRHEALTAHGEEVVGGPAALVDALVAACGEAGVALRTDARVTALHVDAGRIEGVSVGGERLQAELVLSGIDPRQLLSLLPVGELPLELEEDLEHLRCRGSFAKLHLALSGRPALPEGERFRTASHPHQLERAFDRVKHRHHPSTPPLDLRVFESPGGWVASVAVHFAAWEAGWDDATRAALSTEVLAVLDGVAPGFSELVVAAEVLSPADLERHFALTGGHVFHGEHALDQLLISRPTPELARHATPIAGLFLADQGTHPGGGVTCAPGILAARAALA